MGSEKRALTKSELCGCSLSDGQLQHITKLNRRELGRALQNYTFDDLSRLVNEKEHEIIQEDRWKSLSLKQDHIRSFRHAVLFRRQRMARIFRLDEQGRIQEWALLKLEPLASNLASNYTPRVSYRWATNSGLRKHLLACYQQMTF